MRIIDTHLHLVYLDHFRYPWIESVEALNKQFSAEDYFAEGEALGIDRALHMEVDVADEFMEAETDFVLQCHPNVIGAIAAARPENDGFPAHLERLAQKPGVKGIRRILHEQSDNLSQNNLFAQNVKRLSAHNLNFDLCLRADQLPIGTALVDECPDVQFIMDHCGVPKVAEKQIEPWRTYVTDLAKRPNTAAKISGIVAYASNDWTVEDLRPFVEHVIESFGWDRVVWGSDHPVCTQTANLTRWVEATHAIIAGSSESEKAKLLHQNAERIYNL